MGYPSEDHEVIDRIARDVDHHSKTKGFQEEWELATDLEAFAAEDRFSDSEREFLLNAAKALRVNFLGMKLALMHSEISEALERLREVGVEAVVDGDELFIEELGDSVIRVMETTSIIGKKSLGQIMLTKIKSNRDRPYKHGKAH